MPNDTPDLRSDSATMAMPGWGGGGESTEGALGGAGLWLTGGASLLAWTALVLLLTSA